MFSERAAGTYATDDVLPRMVRILADGTGATSATVWLAVGSGLQEMADRLDAVDGSLEIRSAPGKGTTIAGRVTVPANRGSEVTTTP